MSDTRRLKRCETELWERRTECVAAAGRVDDLTRLLVAILRTEGDDGPHGAACESARQSIGQGLAAMSKRARPVSCEENTP